MMDLLKLHALADGELSAEESQNIREQILSSEEAGKEFSSIHNLKDCVRSKAQVFTCEVTLAAGMKRVAELDRKRHVDSFVTRYAWGISGAFFALIAVGGVMNRTVSSNHVQSAEIASMIARPSSSSQSKMSPEDKARYDQWLNNLQQQAQYPSDPKAMQIGAVVRGELPDGRPVMKIALRDANGDLSLLVIPGSVSIDGMQGGSSSTSYINGRIQGLNAVAQNQGARCLVLVGDRSYDQLSDILSHIALKNP